jgi:antirestriction protein
MRPQTNGGSEHPAPSREAEGRERRRHTGTEVGDHDRRLTNPRIYVASLADYNQGELRGAWLDADQDPDELRAEIAAMLARSPEPVAEDWAIHDYEGFGNFQISEYESLAVVSAVALGIAECGPAFAAYAAAFGTDEQTLRAFDDIYLGRWPSLDAYAHHMADEFGWEAALRQLPADMQPFVQLDYQQVANFIDSAMTVVEGGGEIYVFAER